MTQATVTFELGAESVTSVLDINLDTETIITGDFAGAVPAGTTARLRGNVNLTGNMHIRGTLLCDPTGVNLNGNGFDIHTHDGIINLQGVEKSAWVRWGEPVVGWQVGDRLAVAPTKVGVYVPTEITWGGSWSTTSRPVNSPSFTLLDGRVMQPEVVNLAQTVTLRNLQRIMIHEATVPNVQTLKWIRVLDSGVAGVLGMYSIHFHMLGEMARGSLLEGVVVEGSKNHSFAPHASHGITHRDCVAYRAAPGAFWWDSPPDPPPIENKKSAVNNSNDQTWEHCGVLQVLGTEDLTAEGFTLGAGFGNKVTDSFASCVMGKKNASGFHWPGHANQNDGGNVWEFSDNVSHNNRFCGVFIWQNGASPFSGDDHLVEDMVIYNSGRVGWEHGAYANNYEQRRMVIQNSGTDAIGLHAIGRISHTDVVTDGPVRIHPHSVESLLWFEMIRVTTTNVIYNSNEWEHYPSRIRWTDCSTPNGPLTPDDIVSHPTLTPISVTPGGINPLSEIEIVEAGVVVHRWANGAWN